MAHATLVTASAPTTLAGRRAALLPALFALAFGSLLVFGVGFAGADEIHNAAHDSRHSFAFPCH